MNRDEEMPRVEEIRARAAIILARVWFRIAAFGRWLGAPRRAKLRAGSWCSLYGAKQEACPARSVFQASR